MKRNHIERVALPDGVDRFQGEEIACLAPAADGVDVVGACDADGFVVETDALHAADHIHESGFFHACNLGAQHVLQLTVGCHEHHFRGRLHHHQVALLHDAVEVVQVGHLHGRVVGHSLAEATAVDGDDHLVVDVVAIGLERVGIVGLAMGHQAVDNAVGGVFASFDGDFSQFKSLGCECDIALVLAGLQVDVFGLVADGRELHLRDGLIGCDAISAVDVADDALLPVVDDHVDEGQWLAIAFIGDFAA